MPKNKKNKYVLSTRNENLLRDSTAPLEYVLIGNLIDKRPRVRYKDLTAEEERFFKNIFSKVLNAAIHEWEWIKPYYNYSENSDFICELCGTHIKHILKIKNSHTNKEMLIGTECVKHFGIGSREDVDKQSEKNRKTRLINQLDESFPGIERIVDFWDSVIDDCDYILADEYTRSYTEIGSQMKKIYAKFLKISTNQKSRFELIDELEKLLSKGEFENKRIEKLIESYKEDPFAPRKEYLERINDEKKLAISQSFRKGSKVNKLIGWRINNTDLTGYIIPSISEDIQKSGYKPKIIVEYKGKIGVLLNSNKLSYIDFYVSHEDITKIFCEEIFGPEVNLEPTHINKFEELTKSLKIIDYDMMATVVKILLSQSDNIFEVYENDYIDYKYNEVFIKNNIHGTFHQLDLNKFAESFGLGVLGINNPTTEEITGFIGKYGKTMKKSDIDYFVKRRV